MRDILFLCSIRRQLDLEPIRIFEKQGQSVFSGRIRMTIRIQEWDAFLGQCLADPLDQGRIRMKSQMIETGRLTMIRSIQKSGFRLDKDEISFTETIAEALFPLLIRRIAHQRQQPAIKRAGRSQIADIDLDVMQSPVHRLNAATCRRWRCRSYTSLPDPVSDPKHPPHVSTESSANCR